MPLTLKVSRLICHNGCAAEWYGVGFRHSSVLGLCFSPYRKTLASWGGELAYPPGAPLLIIQFKREERERRYAVVKCITYSIRHAGRGCK